MDSKTQLLQVVLLSACYLQIAAAQRNFFLVAKHDGTVGTIGIYKIDQETGAKWKLPLHDEFAKGNSACYDPYTDTIYWHHGLDWSYGTNAFMSARPDGSNFTILEGRRGNINNLVFYKEGNALFYPTRQSIMKLSLDTKLSSRLNVMPSENSQLALDSKRGQLYFRTYNRNAIGVVNVDGSGYRDLFSLRSDLREYLVGMALTPGGDMLYASAWYRDEDFNYESFLYAYNITSGDLRRLGSKAGVKYSRIATDGNEIFVFDTYMGTNILRAPISDPMSFRQIAEVSLYVDDMYYFNYGAECPEEAKFSSEAPQSFSVMDHVDGGDLVASMEMSSAFDCRIPAGDEAAEMFNASASGTTCNVFLKSGQHLDGEMTPTHTFTIEAYQECFGSTMTSKPKTITIGAEASCRAMSELAEPGEVVFEIRVKANGVDRPVRLTLQDSAGGESSFVVNTTQETSGDSGAVTTVSQVVLQKPLSGQEAERHKFTVELDYCVKVQDQNNHAPVFIEPASGAIPTTITWTEEATGVITQVAATDEDHGRYGTAGIRYYVINDPFDNFAVDERTGEVTVVKPLDRESYPGDFLLLLEARDNEGTMPYNLAIASFHLQLLDINDNAPVFEQEEYNESLVDLSPAGHHVLTVEADDADEGDNAVLGFSLTAGNDLGLFSVDEETGEITVAASLSGAAGEHALVLTATDKGEPPLSSSTSVLITVQDLGSLGRRR